MTEYQEVKLNDEKLISVDHTEINGSSNKPFFKLFKIPKSSRSNISFHRNKFLKKISFNNSKPHKIKKYDLLAQDNLNIPIRSKSGRYFKEIDTRQPLIGLNNNSESDEYEGPLFSTVSNNELQDQLIKDGYNFDEHSDPDDLDLMPPRSFRQNRFLSCPSCIRCHIM